MSDDRLLFPALKIDGEIMQRNWQILQAAGTYGKPCNPKVHRTVYATNGGYRVNQLQYCWFSSQESVYIHCEEEVQKLTLCIN